METRRPWIHPLDEQRYVIDLPVGIRLALVQLSDELDGLLDSDDGVVQRVFPVAYPDDPEREAGYQALIRGELIDRHRSGIALIQDTAGYGLLAHDQLELWMTTINAMRLVLGTALGLDDDDEDDPDAPPADESEDLDDDDPRSAMLSIYGILNVVADDIVTALTTRL
jgi:hypothetical protein